MNDKSEFGNAKVTGKRDGRLDLGMMDGLRGRGDTRGERGRKWAPPSRLTGFMLHCK